MEKLVNVVTVFIILLMTGLIVMFFVVASESKQMKSEETEIDSTWMQDQVSTQQNLEIQQNMLNQQMMQPIIVME